MFRTPRSLLIACAVVIAACGGSDSTGPVTDHGGTPDPVAVSNVLITPTSATVAMGNATQLTAVARDANNNTLTNRAITWSSSATNIATVNTQGLVTAVAAGAVTITATSEGKSAQASVAVAPPQPASVNTVTLTPANATLIAGATSQLLAVARDANNNVLADRAFTWTSSNTTIATVSAQGLVTAVGAGAATITVATEGKTAQTAVTVQAAVAPVASVAIATKPDTIEAWDVVNMQAVTRDSINQVLTGRTVKWLSSNPEVASIDENTGVMTGLDRGTVSIRAISEGKSAIVSQVVVIKYRSLTTGTQHACNIASGGLVWCWGLNGTDARIGMSQTGDGVGSNVPVQILSSLRFTQIATYGRFTCGIRTDSKAVCWGSNSWGALGVPTISYSAQPVAVAGNISFRFAIGRCRSNVRHCCRFQSVLLGQ